MSLLQTIKSYNQFSNVEKEISDYILKHKEEIKDMTINDLATATYSSNAAIIRFCRKIGVNGYKEFKINLIQELEKNRNNNIYIDYNYPFHQDESINDIMNNIAKLSTATIEAVYKNINTKDLEKIAKIISNSQNVYCYANGDSLIRMMSFQNKLLKIGKHLINTAVLKDETVYSTFSTRNDCGLFISYSASSTSLLSNAKILKKHGTPIIVITANENAVLTKLADYTLIIPNLESDTNKIATFYSQMAFEYVLNVIYSIIYGIHYTKSHKNKNDVTFNQKEH